MNRERLNDARVALNLAEQAYAQAIRDVFPIGADVFWIFNGHTQSGSVIDHGYGHDIKVRNGVTRKEYWIDAYWVHP